MPFTFSHPAIILPFGYLGKRYLSFTGLFIGSLVPDFEYFIRMEGLSLYGHRWSGLILFDLPLAILISFIYHNIVRNSFLQSMPKFILLRSAPYFGFSWNNHFRSHWFIVIGSILIGGTSHLFWDQLTHDIVDRFNNFGYFEYGKNHPEGNFFIYYLFWSLNSLTGCLLLFYAFWKLPLQNKFRRTLSRKNYWLACCSLFLLTFGLRLWFSEGNTIIYFTDSAIASFLISIIISPILLKPYIFRKRSVSKNLPGFKSGVCRTQDTEESLTEPEQIVKTKTLR